MASIKKIVADTGEECEVNVNELHDKIIAQLPAEKYLDLFHKMQMKIYGYSSPFGNCGCGTLEDVESE